jgi:hypothetical protein
MLIIMEYREINKRIMRVNGRYRWLSVAVFCLAARSMLINFGAVRLYSTD